MCANIFQCDDIACVVGSGAAMMSNVHLAGDDMYSGFGREDVAPALDTADLEYDPGFQAAVKSSYGRRPPTGAGGGLKVPGTGMVGTAGMMSSRGRMGTAGSHI